MSTTEDVTNIRTKYDIPEAQPTVAVARTDIPGLDNEVFEGMFRQVRQDADLPSIDDVHGQNRMTNDVKHALQNGHAEEYALNAIDKKLRIWASR